MSAFPNSYGISISIYILKLRLQLTSFPDSKQNKLIELSIKTESEISGIKISLLWTMSTNKFVYIT